MEERKQLLMDNLKSAILVKVANQGTNHFADSHLYIVPHFQIPNIDLQPEDLKLISEIIMEDRSYGDYLWSLAGLPMWEFAISDPYQLSFIAGEQYGEELVAWQDEMEEKEEDYNMDDVPEHILKEIKNDEGGKSYYTNPESWHNYDSEGFISEEGTLVMFMA